MATGPAESEPILRKLENILPSSPEVMVSFEKSTPESRSSIALPGVSDAISIAPTVAEMLLVLPIKKVSLVSWMLPLEALRKLPAVMSLATTLMLP